MIVCLVGNIEQGRYRLLMTESCSVYQCNGGLEKKPDLSIHELPSIKKMRKAWVDRSRRQVDFTPSKFSFVCSNHF